MWSFEMVAAMLAGGGGGGGGWGGGGAPPVPGPDLARLPHEGQKAASSGNAESHRGQFTGVSIVAGTNAAPTADSILGTL